MIQESGKKGLLRELEEMCAKLLQTARKIPSGPARHATLKEIEAEMERLLKGETLDPNPA